MDRRLLEARVGHVSELLKAHGGGMELVSLSAAGEVVVRFTGMCTGCAYKPVTMASVVRDEILAVPGVTDVRAEGGRMSRHAEERVARYLSNHQWPKPLRRDAEPGASRTRVN